MSYDQQNIAILVLASLFLFGLVFDRFVGRVEDEDPDHGYTAIFVVVGVGVTVGAMGFVVGWSTALLLVAGFAMSGLPMIVGSMRRHLRNRRRDRQATAAALREATGGN